MRHKIHKPFQNLNFVGARTKLLFMGDITLTLSKSHTVNGPNAMLRQLENKDTVTKNLHN